MSCASTCASPSDRDSASRGSAARLGAAVARLRRAVFGRRRLLASLAALAAVLAGCVTVARYTRARSGFEHDQHLKRDLTCVDCHDGAKTKGKAGMPGPAVCEQCHDPKQDAPEVTSGVNTYKRSNVALWPSAAVAGPTYGDVRFSHAKHAGARVDCVQCHEGAVRGWVPNPSGPLTMSACIACHKERGAKTDCNVCHEKRSKDVKPESHDSAWKLRHGFVSRAPDRSVALERCDICHTRADCDRCHAENAPKDHTNPWRVSTHGLSAAMDRSRCMACHEADSCERCHRTEPPRSHRASWGNPRDTHCLTCHEPVGAESCSVCHKGAPSHALAAARPPWHSPEMNCRQCHRAGGQRMPHVDNGTECITCHH